jgi:hypothetical protein
MYFFEKWKNNTFNLQQRICKTFTKFTSPIANIIYPTFFRPHLEFAMRVGIHTKGEIHWLERVQRRATKRVYGLRYLDYQVRLQHFGLSSLSERRIRDDLIQMHKIQKWHDQVQRSYFVQQNHGDDDLD